MILGLSAWNNGLQRKFRVLDVVNAGGGGPQDLEGSCVPGCVFLLHDHFVTPSVLFERQDDKWQYQH